MIFALRQAVKMTYFLPLPYTMFYRAVLLVLFVNVSIHSLWAQKVVTLSPNSAWHSLDYKMEVLEDRTKKLDINAIGLPANQARFYLPKEAVANFGFAPHDYWYRTKIYVGKVKNKDKQWFLQMHNTNTDFISVYFLDSQGKVAQQYNTGDNFLYANRPIDYHKFLFPIPQNAGDTLTVYAKTSGRYIKAHVFDLVENAQLYKDMQYSLGFLLFLLSIIFALLVYNTLLYLSILDSVYLYYIGYLGFILLYLMATTGVGYQLLYPNIASIANGIPVLTAIGSIIFAGMFCLKFLKVKDVLPRWVVRYMYGCVYGGILFETALLFLIWNNEYLTYIFAVGMVYTVVVSSSIFTVGVWCFLKGSRPAYFFLLAWVSLLLGVMIFVLRANGYVGSNFFTERAIAMGTVIEVFLLSFALADRIKTTEREKRKAQRETIEALRANEQMIREQNQLLEDKVQARTQELAASNEELHQTNEELQVTLEVVNKHKKDIEEKNQAITDSINYARRIQEAILPTAEEFTECLPQSFVFFQPRDIVSGDFYFLAYKNNKIIVSAIDCTGHGVPGAFMSMMGKEILNQIILDHEIYEAGIILNELHKGIRTALKQKDSNNRDGMDLALVVIDKENKHLEFSGAKNSMVYIQNNELQTLKADKMPIGGEQREMERIFTKHTLVLTDSPTYVYLFTDGFQDQFGGTEDKKYSIAQLKKTFFEIHTQDMRSQKLFLQNTFAQWVGEKKQIDDVLVLGFCV
ncbi:MAG: hypothetical protein EAZ95_03895 [Bacteroidetes bacterium]|nr:MAG: hypothetical protein EAZ95_03895 [Bacteroidota bacterium]